MEQKMIENILNKYVIEAQSMGRSVILADRIDEVAEDIHQQLLQQTDVRSRFANDKFINNVCASYRHDFGLMATQDRQRLIFECKEWLRAVENNWQNGC